MVLSVSGPATADAAPPAGTISLLLAAVGQLSGDGQLRELIQERRDRRGAAAELWYLPPQLVQRLGLGSGEEEAVAAADPAVITWLQLRFGGSAHHAALSAQQLQREAGALPPQAPHAPVELQA